MTPRARLALLAVAFTGLLIRLLPLLGKNGPFAVASDYDDGVYFSASALLLRGVLPYRDFVFVHPPGILYFLGIVSWLRDPANGFVAARVLAAITGGVNVFFAGRIASRSGGLFAGLVAAGLYAIYPEAANVERSAYLEPALNLLCLSSALLWLRDDRPRPFLAGALAGAACAVKFLGGIWVLAAVLTPASGRARRDVPRFLLGGIGAGVLLLAPVVLPAIREFVLQTLTFQFSRPPDGTLQKLARLPDIIAHGHEVLTALVVLAIGAMFFRRTRTDRFFAIATVLTVAAFLASSSYWNQYNAYLAASECVLAGLGAAVMLRIPRVPRLAVIAAASLLIIYLQLPTLRQTFVYVRSEPTSDLLIVGPAIRSPLPAKESVFAFDPSWSLVGGHLPPYGDGAPVIVDSYGAMLLAAMRSGVHAPDTAATFASAPSQPAVRARLEHSRFVVPGWRGNWQMNPSDRAWFAANFVCATPAAGDLCVHRRISQPLTALATSTRPIEFGEGWFGEEGTPPASWRWMGGRSAITLPPITGVALLHLQFYANITAVPAPPNVTIALDGRAIDRFTMTQPETIRSLSVQSDGAHTLVIATDRTFVPGGNDPRELGLSLKRIIWLPASDELATSLRR